MSNVAVFVSRSKNLKIISRNIPTKCKSHRGVILARSFGTLPRSVRISEEILDAVHVSKRPVVALESAIYTHGFPYPENVALASRLESLVRINGAVPASIGIIDGVARVGLSAEELIELTLSAGKATTRKVSRRDLAYVCSSIGAVQKLHGGTTISSTALLAEIAGIQVFATGGLGGVHRNGENSMDVSADLTELGRTNIAVVSSGCKGFLDITRTLEYLETQGVGVITFADGREGPINFPAFWSRDSGVKSPLSVKDEHQAASIIFAHQDLKLKSGLLFANPVPEKHAIPRERMDAIIAQALEDAQAATSTGSENTPFILNRIRELTEDQSVAVNRALVESNVVRASIIAVELAKLHSNNQTSSPVMPSSSLLEKEPVTLQRSYKWPIQQTSNGISTHSSAQDFSGEAIAKDIVVAGSVALDLNCDLDAKSAGDLHGQFQLHTSNPVLIRENFGGVGRNIAITSRYLGLNPRLCSVVGHDIAGFAVLDALKSSGISTAAVLQHHKSAPTARYISLNDAKRDLHLAVADMNVLNALDEHTSGTYFANWIGSRPKWTVVDANWSSKVIRQWLGAARLAGSKTAFEPVSVAKASRLFRSLEGDLTHNGISIWPNNIVDLTTPNSLELRSMWDAARNSGQFERDDWFSIVNALGLADLGGRDKLARMTSSDLASQGIPQQSIQLLPFIPCITTTLGRDGLLLTQLLRPDDERLRSSAAAPHILSSPLQSDSKVGGIYMRLFQPKEQVAPDEIVSVNGVGDTFLGALIAALVHTKSSHLEEFIDFAQECAVLTLKSEEAVSPALSSMKDAWVRVEQ